MTTTIEFGGTREALEEAMVNLMNEGAVMGGYRANAVFRQRNDMGEIGDYGDYSVWVDDVQYNFFVHYKPGGESPGTDPNEIELWFIARMAGEIVPVRNLDRGGNGTEATRRLLMKMGIQRLPVKLQVDNGRLIRKRA